MNWNGTRVLVTGAGGFIGSHLCEKLVELGAEVTAMIHYDARSDWGNLEYAFGDKGYCVSQLKKKLRVIAGNIEDSDFVMGAVKGQAVVFHLAALIAIPYSYVAPRSYVRTNIEGTLNVLEAGRRCETGKIIHTSTSEVYGTAIYTPIDEQHPLQGQSPYSASKIGADKLAESYALSFNLPVATIRPFNTFGPRQSSRAIIPTIISQALSRNEIHLGALDPVRDLNTIKDTVNGFIAIAESEKTVGEVINIGSGVGISIGDLAQRILKLMDCQKPLVMDKQRLRPEQSEVYQLICDNSKAHRLANWQSRYSLEEGLFETIQFVSEHPGLYKIDQYTI